MTGPDRKYLIRKQGCYYRPNERGYTTSAIQAGRYTREDAEKITHPNGKDGPRDGMSFIHEDELIGIDEDWTAYSALLADRRDPAVLAALPEVQALIAAAIEAGADKCFHPSWQAKTSGDWMLARAAGAIRALTPADATAALARIEREAEARGLVKGLREAAEIAGLNAWKHAGDDDYSRGMDAGAIHQVKACCDAILARADQIEKEGGA